MTNSQSTGRTAQGKSPLYHSHRFWIQAMAVWTFVMLTMFGTVEITGNQLLTFVLSLAGLGVGARTVTGVTGILATKAVERQQVQAQAQVQAQRASCPPCREPTMAERPQPQGDRGKEADGTQPAVRFSDPPFPPLRDDGEQRAVRRKIPPPPTGHKGGF